MEPPGKDFEKCETIQYIMVQANSLLQRDNKLSWQRYWKMITDFGEEEVPPLVDLALSVSLMRQAYNRQYTKTKKEEFFRQALAMLMRYSKRRQKDESTGAEIIYNVARTLHFLGINTQAQEKYE